MAQPIEIDARHSIEIDSLPTMASPLESIDIDLISVAVLGQLSDAADGADGAILRAPFYNDSSKIIVDFTPGDDDWCQIDATNETLHPHHENCTAEALHVAIKLNGNAAVLEAIEKKIQREAGYSVIGSQKVWKPMHRGDQKVIINIMMDNSVAPTALRFVKGGDLKQGSGYTFLQDCVKPHKLHDYVCKVWAELECLEETESEISVLLTAHTMLFVPRPKRATLDFGEADVFSAVVSSKRLRYRF